jgi:hypothetical protein
MSMLLVHIVVPGVHIPVHPPLTQAMLLHATGVPHWPEVLHVCTPLPEHCLAPGLQTPPQLVPTHAYWHAMGFP